MERKLQIRCSDEQKQAWTRAAGGEGSLSEWMRATLDRQARVTTEVGYSDRLASEGGMTVSGKFGEMDTVIEPDPDDDTAPEPEEPMPRIELPVPRPLAVPPQVIEPQYTLPSPTCRNAVYHWKLTAGEACTFCGGRA